MYDAVWGMIRNVIGDAMRDVIRDARGNATAGGQCDVMPCGIR